MKGKLKYILSLSLLLINLLLMAQAEVEMADTMRSNGKIYVVVVIVAIIFIGIVAYLIYIDRKLSKLEKKED